MKRPAPLLFSMISCLVFTQYVNSQENVPAAWTPALQMQLKTPGTPRLAPGARHVVYTVTSNIITEEKSETNTQVWVSATDGSEHTQITSGDKSATNPKWSPDGRSIAYVSNRNNNRNNIYIQEWGTGKAWMLTNLKSGVINYEFDPTGRFIAFTMTDPKTEAEDKAEKGRNDYRYIDTNYKLSRLYLVALDTSKSREVIALATEQGNVSNFDWSPDGKLIVFAHTRIPGQNFASTGDISIVDVASRQIRALASSKLPEMVPQFTADGRSVSFISGKYPDQLMTNEYALTVLSLQDGKRKNYPLDFDGRTTLFPGWAPDGRFYFVEARGTRTPLFAMDPVTGKTIQTNTAGVYTAVSMDPSGKKFCYIQQSTGTPPEVFLSGLDGSQAVQVTKLNAGTKFPPIGKTEILKWTAPDGRQVEGLLTYPVNFVKGKRVPLLVELHGGPNGIFQETFAGRAEHYPTASFAAAGFAVFRPNPRGSTGYGTAFRKAVIRDFGGGDYNDIMSGVEKVIAMGVADPAKMGVMGWSYGGFMTAWIITHNKRFKAASAGAAPVNFVSMTGTSDFPSMINQYFAGSYWNDPMIYQKMSPVYFVKGVTTPTLIQHGEADVRVPVAQGYELYYALKAQGVPVQMMVFPRQGHTITEPKMLLAVMQANLDWFKKYLMPASY